MRPSHSASQPTATFFARGCAILILCFFASSLITPAAATKDKPLGDRYLLLVNTAVASMMTPEKLKQFDQSPYDGLAVAFLHAYDTAPVPSVAEIDAKLKSWKSLTSKTIWPWVYVNRMLAIDPADSNPYSKDAYFKHFTGADLDGKGGAQGRIHRQLVQRSASRERFQSPRHRLRPGVLQLSKSLRNSRTRRAHQPNSDATVVLLKKLGARMADSAATQYPDAVLWFLFTGLTHPDYKTVAGRSYYPAPPTSHSDCSMKSEPRACT